MITRQTVVATMTISAFAAILAPIVQECHGFSPAILARTSIHNFRQTFASPTIRGRTTSRRNNAQHRWRLAAMSDEAALNSNDPFLILGLDAPTTDKKVLKRAYKKRALKFHPDVVTDVHSSPEEKKKASDRFAKINGAYEQLMGKGKGNGSSSTSSNNDSTASSGGWTPPHRRSSAYKSSSSRSSYEDASTDWRDYMPKDDTDYDAGGDSFGQIFSDMFTGAASAAVSGGIGGVGGGIFNEFLEFLEGGAAGGGFASSSQDDADLRELLQTATFEEVSEEMDDTQMVVKQLETKARKLEDEIFAMDAEARMTSKFSEKIELEEKGAELKARKEVVGGYLDRARKRLLKLQTRYKDLKSYGGSSSSRSSSRSSWQDVRDEASTYERKSYTSSSSSYGSTASNSETTPTDGSTTDSDGDAWMNEGFGSGRGGRRGSGRRRASSRSRARVDSNPPPPSPAPSPPPPPSTQTASRRSTSRSSRRPNTPSSSSVVSTSNYSNDVPPHRRTSGSYRNRQEEDRKRMQEIKVDEEFDKLKKELGL